MRSAVPFVQEYGLMPVLLSDMGFKGVAKEVFLLRLSAIHDAILGMRVRAAERASSVPDGAVMVEEST